MADGSMLFGDLMAAALQREAAQRGSGKTQTRRLRGGRFQPGDKIWVRETYYQYGHWELVEGQLTKGGKPKWRFVPDRTEARFSLTAGFQKSRNKAAPGVPDWYKRLGRFMPRRMSRMALIVVEVQEQSLHDISCEDAVAEGLVRLSASGRWVWAKGAQYAGLAWRNPIEAYRWLWEHINGDGSWNKNPEVSAITFKVV